MLCTRAGSHMKVAFCPLVLLMLAAPVAGQSVVISQVYGGGGNQGAEYRNDFIELFNPGSQPVDLTTWTVQYASAGGSSWDRTFLQGVVQPGQYYLVREAPGASGTRDVPQPDASGGINLSATTGKVALVSNSTPLTGTSPSGLHIADFVGYGNANFFEGSPAGTLSNTMAAVRRSNGCMDTGSNAVDFSVSSPNPRNSRSPLNLCGGAPVTGPRISQGGVVNAASFAGGAVAPGEIVTLFGEWMGPSALATLELTPDRLFVTKSLAGTRVLFDGIAAAMIYTSAAQVSAVVPYGLAGQSRTEVRVEYNGHISEPVSLPVATASPGVFTVNSTGTGQVAALNQNGSVNGSGSPAEAGSVVIIFATGGGSTNPGTADGAVVTGAPRLQADVAVAIGGASAEVLYAGSAPFLVSGVVQINARVPPGLSGSALPVRITVAGVASQGGVTLAVGDAAQPNGGGQSVEEKLANLGRETVPPPLPEIPHDRIALPPDWLGLVSWNIQIGGTSVDPSAARPPMVKSALASMFSGTYQILAAQEIPNAVAAQFLGTMVPGGLASWDYWMTDTNDDMDNGFWFQKSVVLRDSFPLFTTSRTDSSGRVVTDPARSLHPPKVAQFEAGDFDFTLINLHLTFADGDTRESAREMGFVLDYLDWYFNQPDHDPDVIVCGDFNIPSRASSQTGRAGLTLDGIFEADGRFREGDRRFAITVHQPTSRSSAANEGRPANNYDHCAVSVDALEEFIQARRVDTRILTDHPDDPEVRLTSDHFP